MAFGALCVFFVSAMEVQAQARITASTMDSNGHVYVTGWRTAVPTLQWEIATTKYDKNGNKHWSHAYPVDPTRPDAESWGIAADPWGNVYVAGHVGTGTNVDCLLIKYPHDYVQGDEPDWVRTWDGGVGHDQNWTIAVDSDGSVYVTGYSVQSHGGVSSSDIVTMKYDNQGNMVWGTPRLYNGPGNGSDNGLAIVVDPVRKTVSVTGTSLGTDSGFDIVTITYDSNGAQRWVQRYSGPAGGGRDRGTSLGLDAEGSVYVTGWSQGTPATGDVDYVTLKYDVGGNQVWVARYNGPAGSNDQAAPPVLAGSGSAYFGNYLQHNQGIIVTAEVLNPAPEVQHLIGRVDALDVGRGLRTSLLAKLNACLDSLLAKNADARQNAHHVLGAFVNQLQAAVVESQIASHIAAELTSVANQIIKGILGIETSVVYVTGQSTNAAGNVDFATIKYNAADGSPMWSLPGQPGTTTEKPGNPPGIALRYNGPADSTDRAWAMAIDLDGRIYVTGPSMKDTASSVDYFTIKYFVNTYQPVALAEGRYNGPGNGVDQACGFATWRDPASGRHYIFRDPATGKDYVGVTGNSIGSGTPAQEYTAVMYDGALVVRWVQRYHF
jgi:uncharacterized delta-60 repeat protein